MKNRRCPYVSSRADRRFWNTASWLYVLLRENSDLSTSCSHVLARPTVCTAAYLLRKRCLESQKRLRGSSEGRSRSMMIQTTASIQDFDVALQANTSVRQERGQTCHRLAIQSVQCLTAVFASLLRRLQCISGLHGAYPATIWTKCSPNWPRRTLEVPSFGYAL